MDHVTVVSSVMKLSNGLFHIMDAKGRSSYTSDANDVLSALALKKDQHVQTRTRRKQVARAKVHGRTPSSRAR